VIESFLDHLQDLLLNHARFFADKDYKIALCHTVFTLDQMPPAKIERGRSGLS
jgi:hypothetical protein